jgi:hypothetical protein
MLDVFSTLLDLGTQWLMLHEAIKLFLNFCKTSIVGDKEFSLTKLVLLVGLVDTSCMILLRILFLLQLFRSIQVLLVSGYRINKG